MSQRQRAPAIMDAVFEREELAGVHGRLKTGFCTYRTTSTAAPHVWHGLPIEASSEEPLTLEPASLHPGQ